MIVDKLAKGFSNTKKQEFRQDIGFSPKIQCTVDYEIQSTDI